MLKIEKTDVYGWEAAIRGMRNPMNSWDKSDSVFTVEDDFIGDNDIALMNKLRKAGTDHRKFMRMITVSFDITAPLYWWKEFDTYKVGTVANSCSTMHKIHDKEITLDDFSVDEILPIHQMVVEELNCARERFLETKDKKYWKRMIQLLPTSYNQKRTVQLNYEVLANMYHSRKNHKLDEWHDFCEWVESLPYSELITGVEK